MTGWIKSNFDDVLEEFDQIADELTPKAADKKEYQAALGNTRNMLRKMYDASRQTILTDGVWKNLQNTDSWKTTTYEYVERAIARNRSTSGDVDIYTAISDVLTTANCPIILKASNRYVLIAGNTTLMACRLIGITPSVIILTIK